MRWWRRLTAGAALALVLLVLSVPGAAARIPPDRLDRVSPPAAGGASPSLSLGPSPLLLPLTPPGGVLARPSGRWSWPLQPQPAVLARFDPPDVVWGAGHRGVDLSASVGQAIHAPTAGTVTFSGPVVDRGVVVITTPSGLRTSFEPVDGSLGLGSAVAPGDVIGHLAATPGHCEPVACLHWGVLNGSTYLDPLAFLGLARVVLLPSQPP